MYKTKRINHIENNFSTRTFSRWAHQGMSEKTALRHIMELTNLHCPIYGAHKFTLSNLWRSQIYIVQIVGGHKSTLSKLLEITNLHCPNL